MDNIIDARELSCPQPVILTKRAMEKNPSLKLTTIVSNKVAQENVSKLADSQGYEVEVEEKSDGIYLHLNIAEEDRSSGVETRDLAILISNQYFGKGDDELGAILMRSFFYTLTEMSAQLKSLIFMNSGVLLTCEDSPVLEHLQLLQASGVEILSCGTCLDFYELKEKFAIGSVTNMYTAMDTLARATKSITI